MPKVVMASRVSWRHLGRCMWKLLSLLAVGLAIAGPADAASGAATKRTVAALRAFGILNAPLALDCSIRLEQGGRRWMFGALTGEQPAFITRTAQGNTSRPILEARRIQDNRLRVVLAAQYAEKPWEIVLSRLPKGTYRTLRSAPLGNEHILSVENGIYVESHRPTPPLQRCRE